MTVKDLAQLRRLQQRIERHHLPGRRHEYLHENHALHEAIVALAGKGVLEETPARLMARVRRVRCVAILSEERWDESVREHAEILAALEAWDAHRAGELMHHHVARAGEVMGTALDGETGPGGSQTRMVSTADDGIPRAS